MISRLGHERFTEVHRVIERSGICGPFWWLLGYCSCVKAIFLFALSEKKDGSNTDMTVYVENFWKFKEKSLSSWSIVLWFWTIQSNFILTECVNIFSAV